MKVYFVSGLAADQRVFRNIRLPDGFEIVYVNWIPPVKKESLHDYSIRLGAGIEVSKPFALLGLSIGGMIATEIALHLNAAITILISSIPVSGQLPFYYKIGGNLGIQTLIPASIVKSAAILKHLFGPETMEDKRILYEMIRKTDPSFIHWGMRAIVKWRNEQYPAPYIHIHGSRDKVLPVRYTQPTHILKGAGHLLVMNRATEVNKILETCLCERLSESRQKGV